MIRYSATQALRDAYALLLQREAGQPAAFDVEADQRDDELVRVFSNTRPGIAVRVRVLDEEADVRLELIDHWGVASSCATLSNATAEALAALIRGYLA
ncbi:hypothetical protein [Aeromicrobium sp. Leaf291]|uniref:hypothetical protein n=1 Tax=Aeromicrobium sp. Leaf291 TaxID=1736325 RepID=UPI0006F59897|nr:hypothetical protein [Aeromicrobium sp. Leaf291]KQP81596.1 hypothetical protein ASF35_16325 [Aeromicrobium sp. Leaf291]